MDKKNKYKSAKGLIIEQRSIAIDKGRPLYRRREEFNSRGDNRWIDREMRDNGN